VSPSLPLSPVCEWNIIMHEVGTANIKTLNKGAPFLYTRDVSPLCMYMCALGGMYQINFASKASCSWLLTKCRAERANDNGSVTLHRGAKLSGSRLNSLTCSMLH
jgi:hypothetical protein